MTEALPRTRSTWKVALLGLMSVLGATSAQALVITGSGTSLPGGGSCSISNIPSVGSGATVSCSGIVLTGHTNVYIGINNAINVNGLTMTGSAPTSGSAAVYRSSSTAASSITYTSTTTVTSSSGFATDTVTNTLTLTRTAGSATVTATGGTPANGGLGDIGHLFRITSAGAFTFDVDASTFHPDLGTAQSCAIFDTAHSTAGPGNCRSGVDVKFYWSDCGDGVTDSPEQCDAGGANGTLGSCCSSTCTFKPNLTACTDDGVQCTNDQCNGASATCLHPNKTAGTACTGNGSGECTNADTCNGSGVCLNNDVVANTPCTDSSPTNCKAARCNGSNVCDQNFTNETNGASCVGANGTGECTNPDTCLTGVCVDNDIAAGTPCTDLTPGDCKDARCNGVNACIQTYIDEPDGNPCVGNGTGECTNADTCASGACNDNNVVSGTACGSSGDTDCDNPDTCNGIGGCQVNNEPNTVVCRAATTGGLCDEVENCDGAGNCPADGFKANGVECRADTGECDVAEVCTGSSAFCPGDGFEAASTPCGDPTDTDCDDADTCDGNNTCLDNLISAGTACGSPANTDCDNPDTCNGSGMCLANNEPGGTPCGDPSNTDCTDPDTCDGAAVCLANHASNGSSCNDGDSCTTGESCTTGLCGGGTDACPDLDHYKCYQGKDLKNPKFLKLTGVDTDDQLANELVDVKKLKFVCSPVDKNGEGINAPNRHLACYQIKAATLAPRPQVEVSTQFQTSHFEIKKGKLLCLPATKSILP